MDGIDRWKLAEELNVYQISLLIAGHDPSKVDPTHFKERDWPKDIIRDVAPYVNAIQNAALSKKFKFVAVTRQGSGVTDIDWDNSRIDIESFCDWMRSRNFADGYFIANLKLDPLADESSEFYAPKLAAAVRAWKEVTSSPDALSGRTPKKALEIWLRKHANDYGLTNKDGNPNEQGIEEICKVANWKPNGGASPTPALLKPPNAQSVSGGRRVRPRPPTPPA